MQEVELPTQIKSDISCIMIMLLLDGSLLYTLKKIHIGTLI